LGSSPFFGFSVSVLGYYSSNALASFLFPGLFLVSCITNSSASRIINSSASRILRCRSWCLSLPASIDFGASPPIYSAYACTLTKHDVGSSPPIYSAYACPSTKHDVGSSQPIYSAYVCHLTKHLQYSSTVAYRRYA
jgi:hypothetical protein